MISDQEGKDLASVKQLFTECQEKLAVLQREQDKLLSEFAQALDDAKITESRTSINQQL